MVINMGFFQDKIGSDSAMRLMCFISLMAAIVIEIIGIFKGINVDVPVIAFLSSSFGGKLWQKKIADD